MGTFHVAGHGDFQWDRSKIMLAEGVALEEATGRLIDDLVLQYNARRRLGVAAFAWLAMRRNNHEVPWREFFEGLEIDSVQESFADEVAATTESPAEVPADPPAGPAAAARRAKSARAPRKAASKRK